MCLKELHMAVNTWSYALLVTCWGTFSDSCWPMEELETTVEGMWRQPLSTTGLHQVDPKHLRRGGGSRDEDHVRTLVTQ